MGPSPTGRTFDQAPSAPTSSPVLTVDPSAKVSSCRLDPAEYPFVHQVAAQLPGHDDREQFLAGISAVR